MKVLSIQTGHNATIALSNKGEIVGVLGQEKCDNIKNSSAFPMQAIESLLKEINWHKQDIEKVLICSENIYPDNAFNYFYDKKGKIKDTSTLIAIAKSLRNSIFGKFFPSIFQILRKKRLENLIIKGRKELYSKLKKIGFNNIPFEHVEHHLCHARAVYHSFANDKISGDSIIFTLDGAGDNTCSSVTYVNKKGVWNKIAETPLESSLGNIYSFTTKFLGMNPLEHEYKVMGLAAYSKQNYVNRLYEKLFKPVIWLDEKNNLVFKSKLNTNNFYDYLVENAIGERFDNIAGALQLMTEKLVCEWIINGIKKTSAKNIFLSGGVFMNVKLNQKISEIKDIEKLFLMPSCGDESNPIGACYYNSSKIGEETKPLRNLYLGISHNQDEVHNFIRNQQIDSEFFVKKFDDIDKKISHLLIEREVVARFSGRGEWGARSLGNRAILAHPSHMESFYMVNDYIKARDFWMPFAPTILESYARQYLQEYNPKKLQAPHMIVTYRATEKALNDLRGALHQGDHTLRPQVLSQSANPSYFRLITLFEKETGVGGLMNTSFNLHGFPLVSGLDQAVNTFKNSELKYLSLGDFLVSKKRL